MSTKIIKDTRMILSNNKTRWFRLLYNIFDLGVILYFWINHSKLIVFIWQLNGYCNYLCILQTIEEYNNVLSLVEY